MSSIQILDIKQKKDNQFMEYPLSKKELEKTIGGGGDNCVKTSDGNCFCR